MRCFSASCAPGAWPYQARGSPSAGVAVSLAHDGYYSSNRRQRANSALLPAGSLQALSVRAPSTRVAQNRLGRRADWRAPLRVRASVLGSGPSAGDRRSAWLHSAERAEAAYAAFLRDSGLRSQRAWEASVAADWRPHCPYLAQEVDSARNVARWLAEDRGDGDDGEVAWLAVQTEALMARHGYVPTLAPWRSLLPGASISGDQEDADEEEAEGGQWGSARVLGATGFDAIDLLNRFTDLLACRRSETLKLLSRCDRRRLAR